MAAEKYRRMTIKIREETAEILEATASFENRKASNLAATVIEQWADSDGDKVRVKPVKGDNTIARSRATDQP